MRSQPIKKKRQRRKSTSGAEGKRSGHRSPAAGSPTRTAGWVALGVVPVLIISILFWSNRSSHPEVDVPSTNLASTLTPPPSQDTPAGETDATLAGDSPVDIELSAERLNEGNRALRAGRFDEAIEAYQAALRANPEDEDTHYNLGIAFAKQGNTTSAIAHYETALRLFPEYPEVHNNLGNLFIQQGRFPEAIQHFEAAIEAIPDYAQAYNNLGNALGRQGQFREAARNFRKATRLDPTYFEAFYNLGKTYSMLNQADQAVLALETAVRLRPDFRPARSALRMAQSELAPRGTDR